MTPKQVCNVLCGAMFLGFALGTLGCESGVKVTSVTPEHGTVAGGEDVIIRGRGFKAGVQVSFCRAEAKNVVILGDNQIKVTSPANPKGMCDIVLTFDDGTAYKVPNAFRYMEPSELMKRDMLGTKASQGQTKK